MKYALVGGRRQEAQPNLSGECPACGRTMVAKCGEVRVRHWAHMGRRLCDSWWENETDWHRRWKNQFPAEWQEIVHTAGDGERHIADVKTACGWVIEFQHSFIEPEERRSRESFYAKLIWVVDGTRRKRDRAQLIKAWKEGVHIRPVQKVSSHDCALLREWAGSNVPILIDLGELEPLWWLAKSTNESAYLVHLPRASFIQGHCSTVPEIAHQFGKLVSDVRELIGLYESHARAQLVTWDPLRLPRPRRQFRF